MRLLISENQYKSLIMEYYDRNRPYVREEVIKALKNAPGYIKQYLRGLPRFYIRDEKGEPYLDSDGKKLIFTNIPEVLYDYLRGIY